MVSNWIPANNASELDDSSSYLNCSPSDHLLSINESDFSKRYKCPVCDRKFTAKGSMKTHLTVHTGELLYKCWEYSSNDPDYQSSHSGSQHSSNVYRCNYCSYTTKFPTTLKRHILTHTDDGNSVKKVVYKQKFRMEWLKDPMLKEWLTYVLDPVEGTKMPKCKCCNEVLSTKLYDLKSHAGTMKHNRSAARFFQRQ
ncbi:zinc finger protein 555-like [Argiope bruennichi]|uniref:Zinc finger protein 335 like protein n=1 Tax=Argiope bruennichi TaxID=94029 RepID=A0A8T0FWW3_ARGBR|nr:zinc finger protein 555-like [Argiope bruennichi]XP_055931633.1 zinc finger protein 555-like [Argiope bruennichi]KAF8794139.1 Zinc finger protein 335 like protein [Argiope bruennichi]